MAGCGCHGAPLSWWSVFSLCRGKNRVTITDDEQQGQDSDVSSEQPTPSQPQDNFIAPSFLQVHGRIYVLSARFKLQAGALAGIFLGESSLKFFCWRGEGAQAPAQPRFSIASMAKNNRISPAGGRAPMPMAVYAFGYSGNFVLVIDSWCIL